MSIRSTSRILASLALGTSAALATLVGGDPAEAAGLYSSSQTTSTRTLTSTTSTSTSTSTRATATAAPDSSTTIGPISASAEEEDTTITASAASDELDEIGGGAQTGGGVTAGIVDDDTFDEMSNAMVADILGNPSYSDATKAILVEQLANDFDVFNQVGAAEPTTIRRIGGGKRYTAEAYRAPGLRLEEIRLLDPFSREQNVQNCGNYSPCLLPLHFNAESPMVTLVWSFGSSDAQNTFRAALDGAPDTGFNVKRDGIELNRSTDQRYGIGFRNQYYAYIGSEVCGPRVAAPCLVTTFSQDTWFHESLPWSNWSIDVEAWSLHDLDRHEIAFDRFGNPVVVRTEWVVDESANGLIAPQPVLTDFFTETIGQSILSERCTSCHALDTPAKIVEHHSGLSVYLDDVVQIPSAVIPGDTINGCVNCHEGTMGSNVYEFDETRWATPPTHMDIDWAQIVEDDTPNWARNICDRVVVNMPTHDIRKHHFHEDIRLFWAVDSGVSPFGVPLGQAQPENYVLFLKHFDAWNDSGARCPQ